MPLPSSNEITVLLQAWRQGDQSALEQLAPLVEAELHRLGHRYLMQERPCHVLQTTALINEAYLRLIDWKNVEWQDRAHFFGVASWLMRHTLVAYAKRQPRVKAGLQQVSLDAALKISPQRSADLVALDDALNGLAAFDARKSQIVELRFFGGLSVDETAEVLKVAPITVMREWNKAKAWLYDEVSNLEQADDERRV
jgi:RNA polymerase sigma factor (TIGR02999 family)